MVLKSLRKHLLVKFDLLRHTLNKDVLGAKIATTLTKERYEPMKNMKEVK